MIRINMDPSAKQAGYENPAWFRKLLNDAVTEFCHDYQVGNRSAYQYIFDQAGNLKSLRLTEILRTYKGVDAVDYHIDGLPSWGVLLREDDPVVFEYKLKHG